MKCFVSFKNTEAQQGVIEFAQKKASRLDRYTSRPLALKVSISFESPLYTAEVAIKGGKDELFAKASQECVQEAIDLMFQKLSRQMIKKKNRRQRRRMKAVSLEKKAG